MSEIKTYLIRAIATFNASHYPTQQKVVKYVRALNEKQAIEYLYSYLGSKNKIKRYNIKIQEIKEVPIEQANDKTVKDLAKLSKIIM
ncbi:50S ribosomal protein L18Ae [Sulfurisphaera javensis]|uniref:Large ribosomal subunit protein eL20 n=1 Tax=Sulfurisphaera javensis TaxID=2049879 RepID=A0AAT9GU40_9CREN